MDESSKKTVAAQPDDAESARGIYALDVSYEPVKAHIEKVKCKLDSKAVGSCSICKRGLPRDGAATVMCPIESCSASAHLECFATAFMKDRPESLVPTTGSCPSCRAHLQWSDLVKELTLRMRGQKDIDKLFKVKKARGSKKAEVAASVVSLEEEASAEDDDDDLADDWHRLSDFSEDETADKVIAAATRSDPSPVPKAPAFKIPRSAQSDYTALSEPAIVIEDSDEDCEDLLLT